MPGLALTEDFPAVQDGSRLRPAVGRGAVGTIFCAGVDRSRVACVEDSGADGHGINALLVNDSSSKASGWGTSRRGTRGSASGCAPRTPSLHGTGDASSSTPPPADDCGKSRVPSAAESSFHFTELFTYFFINIQGFTSSQAELTAVCESLGFPTLVGLNETFLTKGTESMSLPGYSLVSRRDRSDNSGWGGIALFVKAGFEDFIVHIGTSAVAERTWHILHTDRGPILVGLWYRPPNKGEIATIQSLDDELAHFGTETVGTLVIGDMNVHETSWRKCSDGTSIEGRELRDLCAQRGLEQYVEKPTRNDYLLDLVLSDLGSLVKASVVPKIADHEGVFGSLTCPLPEVRRIQREVFVYSKADWTGMRQALRDTNWETILCTLDADRSAAAFEEFLMSLVRRFIPSQVLQDSKGEHPWLTDRCRELIRRKRAAQGTADFQRLRDECSTALLSAYNDFLQKTRDKLRKLKKSSREWWRLSRTLMSRNTSAEVIPPLRASDGSWARTPGAKASLLAQTFAAKCAMEPCECNEFSDMPSPDGVRMNNDFVPIRRRYSHKVLKGLKENSGTGPDRLAARVLRRCRAELEMPVTLLARIIFNNARWPEPWRLHWIHPLFKKKSRADPTNYRGIHLTPQISKVIERVIGCTFLPWLNQHRKFGPHQYAYSKQRSHKDALAVNVCNWLLMLERGQMVGLYCSDVSGAFDRVPKERLAIKLRAAGLNDPTVQFLTSWLDDRKSYVIVGGERSAETALTNSVFQGTVLGSPLWNLFYVDANSAVRPSGFTEVVFADDFNAWKGFEAGTAVGAILAECRSCQDTLHRWGRANSVKFDSTKESFHVLHRRRGYGDDFRLLGVDFDSELVMDRGCCAIAKEAGWRLQSVLKPKRFFTQPELMNLYKSQVLSYLESGTPGFYHASRTVLFQIDRVQLRLLRQLGLTEVEALQRYRLAPLPARRDMAMLAVLHRIVLGSAPSQLAQLFPFAPPRTRPQSRLLNQRHNKQFVQREFRTDTFKRSLFGCVVVYNLLPQAAVDTKTPKSFQRTLQKALLRAAEKGTDDWQHLYTPDSRHLRPLSFQALFV